MPDTPSPPRALTQTQIVDQWRKKNKIKFLYVREETHKLVRIHAAAEGISRGKAAHQLIVAGTHALTDYAAIEALKSFTDAETAKLDKDSGAP